jgi:Na+-translocating ferredoxin:NAD+ oxidoreductase RnfC subunit
VRFETNSAVVQFAVKTLDVGLEKRSLDAYRQIADASVEQSLIRNEAPSESCRHWANCSCVCFERLDGFGLSWKKKWRRRFDCAAAKVEAEIESGVALARATSVQPELTAC